MKIPKEWKEWWSNPVKVLNGFSVFLFGFMVGLLITGWIK